MARLLQKKEYGLEGVNDGIIPPEWVQGASDRFHAMLCDKEKPFPCYFGTIAELKGSLRYTYVEDSEIDQPLALRDSLVEYLEIYPCIKGRSALIAFVGLEKEEACLEDYESEFWHIIQFLHDHDPRPWPLNMPIDANDPQWQICFAGQPLFITGHSPLYTMRRSRHSGSGLLLVIQTRTNLQGIVGHNLTAERVRSRIRGAIQDYDSVALSPYLGIYGDDDTREWKQYWLFDSNITRVGECPLRISRRELESKPAPK